MILRLNRNQQLCAVMLWEYVFIMLSALQINTYQILNIFGFLTLLLLPGLLTVIMLRLTHLSFWANLTLMSGFGMLEVVATALVGNYLLPFFGIAHPLERSVLLAEFAILVPTLLVINWWLDREPVFVVPQFAFFDSAKDAFVALLPALFVALAVIGALRLNNGGDGGVTLTMLVGIGVYCAFLVWQRNRLGTNVIPTALFFISLSLLLMTSLRGWHTTGHDIQREFGVFQFAKLSGIWNIAAYRDAYNACLSITILPTIFSNLLQIPDPYIYKVLFQVLFATVPVILYLTVRRYASVAVSFLSVLYFVSFPTFFGDMPFLNRQEIAFLYLALMLYLLADTQISLITRKILFVVFGIGMVLSHYSTTYTVVALLIGLLILRPLLQSIGKRLSRRPRFVSSAFAFMHPDRQPKAFVSFSMVVLLASASFFWSSVVTNTASASFSRVVNETIAVMRDTLHQEYRSDDVSYSLFSRHKVDLPELYAQYKKNVVAPARTSSPSAYYSDVTYAPYRSALVLDDRMPLTPVGKTLESAGLAVPEFNDTVRQDSAKLLQILILVGLVVALVSSQFVEGFLSTEIALFSITSLFFVVAQVILPVLSVEYGVLRAFQQALFFLSVFVVGGSYALLFRAATSKKVAFASTLAIIFFLSSTGVITQTLGGYGAQLHLNNSGSYYDQYYLHDGELSAVAWLKQTGADVSRVQASPLLVNQLALFTVPENGIYPELIKKGSYVLLSDQTVERHTATDSFRGSDFSYTYPIEFLDAHKDLIYATQQSNIYR